MSFSYSDIGKNEIFQLNLKPVILYLLTAAFSVVFGWALIENPKVFVLLIAIVGTAVVFKFHRAAVIGVIVWLLIEGYIRRKIAPNIALVFFKDAVLAIIYFKIFLFAVKNRSLKTVIKPHEANIWILMLLLWGIAEVFNPHSHYLYGLLGLKVWFFYMPLFYIIPTIFPDLKSFKKILILIGLSAIPICTYAILQVKLGWLENDPYTSVMIASDGSIMHKPNATFYYSGNFATYSHLAMMLNMALILCQRASGNKKYNLLFYAALAFSMVGVATSAARTAWLIIVLQVPVLFMMLGKIRPKDVVSVTTAAVILILLMFKAFPVTKRYFMQRLSTVTVDPYGVVVEKRGWPQLKNSFVGGLKESPLIGHGIGTASTASRFLRNIAPELPNYGEGGLYKTLFELGLIGFVFFMGVLFNIYKQTLKVFKTAATQEQRILAATIFVIQLGYIIWYIKAPVFDEFLSAIMFWTLAGISFVKSREKDHPATTDNLYSVS